MGFYSPHSLVQDARRHGVHTLPPDINSSEAEATLVLLGDGLAPLPIRVKGAEGIEEERRDHGWAVRLGIDSIRTISDPMAKKIAAGQSYSSIEDVARKTGVNKEQLEALATAGCFDLLSSETATLAGAQTAPQMTSQTVQGRRQALWTAGAVVQGGADKLAGIVTGVHAPQLPGMSKQEEALADLWATGIAPDGHPTVFIREEMSSYGVIAAEDLHLVEHNTKVLVGGVVTHRQRPATASGVSFIGLEDETGLINIVVSVGCWARYRKQAQGAPALLVRGRCERQGEVVNIVAERLESLLLGTSRMSRDFR